jgi:capsular polysaccharide export protein
MFGLIKLPKAHPDVLATLRSAIDHPVEIRTIKPSSPFELARALPASSSAYIDYLADLLELTRQGTKSPYHHRLIQDVDRRTASWLLHRMRFETRARAAYYRIGAAKLRGAVTWNGQVGDPAVVTHVLHQLGIPTLFAELSPFKGRYFLDFKGVNAASSLQSVQPEEIAPYDDEEDLFSRLKGNYIGRRSSSSTLNDPSGLPRDFVFAALQVPTDTQIILHGGEISRQSDYIALLGEVLPLLPRGTALVVKPHPMSPYSEEYLRHVVGREVFVASGYETRDLLERCRAIVTVNSSIGVDGFLFDKPVIAVGNAPWVKPALAMRASTAVEIATAIASLPKFEKRLRQRFLAHWFHAYTWQQFEKPAVLREFVARKLQFAQQQLAPPAMAS